MPRVHYHLDRPYSQSLDDRTKPSIRGQKTLMINDHRRQP
ncbi:Protein of unknown function [Pyronema omphalodes CBS 100304]|uniref:Uncharacterized protein n=1 Tax=Pyronema omphalodes (strain CBS 100304) TaxID=1076935 RepID=U4KVZ1_PYROM|nr:Protein of unknown function [Pyronema omphalodes CBS 100304]